MTPPLFLLAEIPGSEEIYLSGDEGRHAARVMRIGPAETVLVSDGAGKLLTCEVRAVTGDGLQLAVRDRGFVPVPQPNLVVMQALPKGERGLLAVEVMTELGVDEIVPWAAARSVTRWVGPRGEKALEKWRAVAGEAAKQSRRGRIPRIGEYASVAEVAARLASADAAFVLHEGAGEPLATTPLPLVGQVVVVVGPEGGVTPDELDAFVAAGAKEVRLSDTVLRTTTAGAAAVTALSLRLGRWGAEVTAPR